MRNKALLYHSAAAEAGLAYAMTAIGNTLLDAVVPSAKVQNRPDMCTGRTARGARKRGGGNTVVVPWVVILFDGVDPFIASSHRLMINKL